MNKNDMMTKQQLPRQNLFRINETEIYMIKENNLKKVHEVVKSSYIVKNSQNNVNIIFNHK
jgi:hypothetical protein